MEKGKDFTKPENNQAAGVTLMDGTMQKSRCIRNCDTLEKIHQGFYRGKSCDRKPLESFER